MKSMKEKILEILRSADDYVSGQDLCQHLGVSRTAVWKVIKQLKEEGYGIEAVNNKGYRIVSYPDILSEAEIVSRLGTKWLGKKVYYYDEIGSTNNEAKVLAEQNAHHGSVIVADMQSAGKGRRGRSFESPKGTGIWMSILLRPDIAPSSASMLTLLAAMAVMSALKKNGIQADIKWPNDVVINGRKINGTLTEMSTEFDYINYVVVGIGINVNVKSFPDELKDLATSLYIETGKTYKRAAIMADVLEAFEAYYEIFLKTEDLSGIMEEYNSMLINIGKEVRVISPVKEYMAVSKGINKNGELLIIKDGKEETIVSGEVSVRGVLGYV